MDQTTTPRRRMRWAAVVLLGAFSLVAAACGDDDDGGDEAASGSETGSETAGGEDFCQAMREIDEQEFEGQTPTADELGDVMERLAALDPPAEIAEPFNQMVEGLQEAFVDPASAPQLADQIDEATQQVDAYLQAECGAG
jgi:hypothetical protein